MSLKDQFASDVDTIFVNLDEHGTTREFRIANGSGGFRVFSQKVVWDEAAAREQPAVKLHGVFMGDVVCFMPSAGLPRIPLAGELIYSPANQPWEVLECVDEIGCYKMSLMAHRSQPGHV